MKKIGFVGAYDKKDLVLYIAKILTELKNRVLVIDSTIKQKTRYIVPSIRSAKSYITEFEGFEVAAGFNNYEVLTQYLGVNELEYDYILIDTDRIAGVQDFDLNSFDRNYFVTSFDNYFLKRGVEILTGFGETINLTKVLFAENMLKEEDDYLNYLTLGQKILWNEFKLYFPIENGDLTVIHENQRLEKISLKKLSVQYRDGIGYLVQEIDGNVNKSRIRKIIKGL